MDIQAFIDAQVAQSTSRADLRNKVCEVIFALQSFIAALDSQNNMAPDLFAAQNPAYIAFVEAIPIPSLATIVDTLKPAP